MNDLIKLIRLFIPSFHNKLTWLLVIFGISLIGTPLIEIIINKIFETQFSISITSENDITIGITIISIALIYNILTNYFVHKETIKKLENHSSKDKDLYDRLLIELPSKGSIDFLRNHDFHNPFHINKFDHLFNFIYEWDNAEHEFINKDIEKTKKTLLDEINQFLDYSGTKTYPLKVDFQTVMTNIDSEIELSEETKKNISKLNEYGSSIYNLHQKLIRKGRENLYI